MKLLHLLLFGSLIYISIVSAYAARISIDAPKVTPPTGEAIPVVLFLDPEGETMSGITLSFSFPEELFSVDRIDVKNSIIQPWVVYPTIEERLFDRRTHITFEGIFAGGFSGVRSAYYAGTKEGILATVYLIPRAKGEGELIVDSIQGFRFDEKATPLYLPSEISSIAVSSGMEFQEKDKNLTRKIPSTSIVTLFSQSSFVGNNAVHLVVYDREPKSSIKEILVAEKDTGDIEDLKESDFRRVTSPYVLRYQDRSKYVHIKIIYSDNTYTTKVLQPVENSKSSPITSNILLGTGILSMASVIYLYVKRKQLFTKKKSS